MADSWAEVGWQADRINGNRNPGEGEEKKEKTTSGSNHTATKH